MTDFEKKVEAILRDSEDQLLELLAKAGEARDYDSIEMIRAVARELDEIASSLSEATRIASRRDGETSDAPSNQASLNNKRGRYPHFVVDAGALEKVGWSPKREAEYSHRIPRAEFDAVLSTLEKMARESEDAVSSGEILEELGGRVKHYQVYGVLRFLRSNGVIAPAARGAYSVPVDVSVQAEAAWKSLEQT